jgi:Glycosyltransferase 61
VARGLPKWQKAFDLKPWAAKLFQFLEQRAPAFASAIGYFSRFGPPEQPGRTWIAEHPIKIASGRYRALYDEIAKAAVDQPKTEFEPFTVKTQTWLVDRILLPGHTVAPVERQSTKVVSAFGEGNFNWGFAFPSPIFIRRRAVEGLVCPVPPVKNYYHLLIDFLLPSVFALIRHRDELGGRPVSFVTRKPVSVIARFVDALNHIGIESHVVVTGPTERIEPATGFLAYAKHTRGHFSHGYWPGRERDILAKALDEIIPSIETGPRIYIPRTETRIRKLTNEAKFLAALEGEGFRPFVARWSNFDEQFRTFSQAREIVSVHGAGLSNVCWCNPGTVIQEIMPANARRSHFLQIGAEQDLDYRLFFASAEGRRQNFSIDIEAFMRHRRNA